MIMARHICGTTSKFITCLSQRSQMSVNLTKCSVAWFSDNSQINGTSRRKVVAENRVCFGSENRPLKTVFLFDAGRTLHTVLTSVRDGFLLQKGQANPVFNFVPARGIAAQARTEIGAGPSPQGVQGDDCATFLMWIERCRRFGVENCDEQLQGIQSGRKTLSDVLQEQEKLIVEIAKKYKEAVAHHTDQEGHYIKGVDDDDYSLDFHSPCTQGIQGDDCDRFKLWLEKCHEFGFVECMDELQGLQGKRTLQEIFSEHELLIRKVVQNYQPKSSFSTSARAQAPADRNPKVRTEGSETEKTLNTQITQAQKLKRAVKEYGATVIVFHVALSLASLGGFYVAVSSGIDVVGMMQKVGVAETFLQSKLAAGAGTFVVAYAVHKVFAPVRIGITLTATPFIVRYLRRIGFLKPPKSVRDSSV